MSTFDGSLRRDAALAACAFLLAVLPAAAQQQRPATAPQNAEFFSRYDFHLGASALSGGDSRFSWDTRFGGELDVVDYVKGRTSVVIDFEALLGSQLRPFDPIQGNYTLEAGSSYRVRDIVEIAGMFHHVSRHLGDRDKKFAIAWNVLGARLLRRVTIGGTTLDMDADLGWITQRAYVDYKWTGDADVAIRRQVRPRAIVFGRGSAQVVGISADESSRSTQTGGKLEVGVLLAGTSGGIELFVGVERRIDADPLLFESRNWALAGFRLVGR